MNHHNDKHNECKGEVRYVPVLEKLLHRHQLVNFIVECQFVFYQAQEFLGFFAGETLRFDNGPELADRMLVAKVFYDNF